MIKKGLFKKVTALTLALCLAASPTFVYAADDVVEVFAEEEESVSDDVGYSSSDDAEEVFKEEVQEDIQEEETVYDEPEFVGEDIVEENNEPVFVENIIEEQTATEEVAEAFGVDDDTMEQLVAGTENDVTEDVISEEGAGETPAYADITITFNSNGGSGSMQQIKHASGTRVSLPENAFSNANGVFTGWNTKADGSGFAYTDQQEVQFTADTTLYAQWALYVAKDQAGNPYKSLSDAFSAASAKTITLTNSVKFADSATAISVNRNITLDLKTYTITGNSTNALFNIAPESTFTVIGTGSITNAGGVAIQSSGKFVSGTSTSDRFTITGTTAALKVLAGNLGINYGTFKATGSTGASIEINASDNINKEIYGGTFSGGAYAIAVSGATTNTVKVMTTIITSGKAKISAGYVWVSDSSSGISTLKTLDDAFKTAHGTYEAVKLFDDLELDKPITVSSKATIDLNGHSIKNKDSAGDLANLISIAAGGDLTITNSSSTEGGVINSNYVGGAVTFAEDGKTSIGKSSSDRQTI